MRKTLSVVIAIYKDNKCGLGLLCKNGDVRQKYALVAGVPSEEILILRSETEKIIPLVLENGQFTPLAQAIADYFREMFTPIIISDEDLYIGFVDFRGEIPNMIYRFMEEKAEQFEALINAS